MVVSDDDVRKNERIFLTRHILRLTVRNEPGRVVPHLLYTQYRHTRVEADHPNSKPGGGWASSDSTIPGFGFPPGPGQTIMKALCQGTGDGCRGKTAILNNHQSSGWWVCQLEWFS